MSSPDRAEVVQEIGKGWLAEVARLRALTVPDADGELIRHQVPQMGDGPEKFAEALLVARACLDRVEEILSAATAMASGARIAAREKAEAADDELDKVIDRRSKRARDFEAARERIAAARLDNEVFPKIAEARSAQKVADMAASIEARVRLAHRGLDGMRQDLAAALRHVSWESSLDR